MKPAIFCAVAFVATSLPATVQAQSTTDSQTEKSDPATWRLSAGVNYSTGDYGDTRSTEVISTPVALKYSKGPLFIRVSVPFVHISGPGSLLDTPDGSGGGSDNSGSGSSGSGSGSSGSGSSGSGSSGSGSSGGSVDSNLTSVASKRSGIGDVSVSLGYSIKFGQGLFIDTLGRVKLPTASTAKRLGSGKADFTLGADLVKDIGNGSIYAGGRHKFTGSTAALPLRDIWGIGAGASVRASKGVTFGADYDWQQSSTIGKKASSDITGWTSFRLNNRLRMQLYGSTGLNANSADFAGGMSLSWRL